MGRLFSSLLPVLCLFLSSLALAAPVEYTLSIRHHLISYFATLPLTESNPAIEKLIIVVHGSERNAITYFNTMNALVKKTGNDGKMIAIAPHFKEVEDVRLDNELTYTSEGWLSGDPSLDSSPISSFEVMDHFIRQANSLFPNLRDVVVTGHSAGGQFTQRYAVGSTLEDNLPGIRFRYVVANPGSYVYLTAQRPITPAESCAYNHYKFGLVNLNDYMSSTSIPVMIGHYLHRKVTYLLGELDNDPASVDQSCEAQAQGDTRLHRGMNFKAQLDAEFPENEHAIVTVPNVAHTQWGMYTSANGTRVLFENL